MTGNDWLIIGISFAILAGAIGCALIGYGVGYARGWNDRHRKMLLSKQVTERADRNRVRDAWDTDDARTRRNTLDENGNPYR
jgi:hypothetical protein